MNRKVVITGMGTINPLGNSIEKCWKQILSNNSAVRNHYFDNLGREFLAARLRNDNTYNKLSESDAESILYNTCIQACDDANLDNNTRRSLPLFVGTSLGWTFAFEKALFEKNFEKLKYLDKPEIDYGTIKIAEYFGGENPKITISSTCTSGMNAIGTAYEMISYGLIDRALVVGYDFLSDFIVSGIKSTKGISMNGMKPFDISRDGMVLGEGAGAMILEAYESLVIEKKHMYAEIAGYKSFSEAYHLMVPELDGYCGEKCLNYDGLDGSNCIVVVSGNGTKYNDQAIFQSIDRRFGKDKPYVSNIKALLGHTLGASAVIEGVLAVKSMLECQILPIFGMKQCEYDMKYVKELSENHYSSLIHLCTSFGGNISSILYKVLE